MGEETASTGSAQTPFTLLLDHATDAEYSEIRRATYFSPVWIVKVTLSLYLNIAGLDGGEALRKGEQGHLTYVVPVLIPEGLRG